MCVFLKVFLECFCYKSGVSIMMDWIKMKVNEEALYRKEILDGVDHIRSMACTMIYVNLWSDNNRFIVLKRSWMGVTRLSVFV